MKIDKENFKIISGHNVEVAFDIDLNQGLRSLINFCVDTEIPQVFYPTQTFIEAAIKCADKLDEIRPNIPVGVYAVLFAPDIEVYVKVFKVSGRKHMFILDFISGHITKISNEDRVIEQSEWFNVEQNKYWSTIAEYVVLFKFFADIEILELSKTKPTGKLLGCKYSSSVNQNILILNSSWFTTIINNTEFKVRGHFGFRAVGVGKKERRLVWIKEYKKSGYNRKAKNR